MPHLGIGRVPMNQEENAALDKLAGEHEEGTSFTVSREDPGNTGALLVQHPDGTTWRIAEDGKRRKLA